MKFSELWQVFGDLCLLDPDAEVLLNLNPSLFTQFHYQHNLFKNLKMESEESSELRE